jgi:hypothetical protein
MRSKVTVVLLFLNVVLFAYIYWFDRPEVDTPDNRRTVLPTEIASMDSLTRTTRTGEVVKLEKRGESWWITKPYEWPANPDAVAYVHNELQFLQNQTSFPVADLAKGGQSLADYGLADPAVTLEFTAAGNPKVYKLLVGDDTKVGNRLYVLSPDGARVHVVGRSLTEAVGLSLANLRNESIFTIPVFEVRSLNIQTTAPTNLKVRLRRDAASRWGFESPILARASKVAVEVTINALNSLAARTFVDPREVDLERSGLGNPALRVTLEGNARRETLLIGNAAADSGDYYAKIEDKAVVFTVPLPPKLLEVLRSSQELLRDTHVVDFEPSTVTSLTISAPGRPELALQRLEAPPSPASAVAPTSAPAAAAVPSDASVPASATSGALAREGWQVVTRIPGQAPITVPGDPAVIDELLQKLKLLSARETVLPNKQVRYGFLSDAPSADALERYGFNRPEREITLNLNTGGGLSGKEPSTQVLQIGVSPDEPGRAFARLTNPPFVYEILPDILAATATSARHYHVRQLRDLPDGAVITSVALVDLANGATLFARSLNNGDKNWEALIAAEPEAGRPVLRGLIEQLRRLRAQSFAADTFSPDHAETAQGPVPWRYRLDYTIAFNRADASQATPSSLMLTERFGGSNQLAGTADFGGVVFNLTQELVDSLFAIIYANQHDPGPPKDEAAPAPAGTDPAAPPAPVTPPATP